MAKRKRTNNKDRTNAVAEKQALAMWTLLGDGGAGFGGKLTPKIEKPERDALLGAGLITVERRERGALLLTVTDRGWEWAEHHLADPLPQRTQGGAFVLRAWLSRLQKFLQSRQLRLYELFASDETEEAKPDPSTEYGKIREQIRAAYREAAGGFDRRLLLRNLRPRLAGIDRELIDSTLLRMVREGEASLMQLDYRPDVTDDDRAASIQIGNEPRHIIWIVDR
ncbi:hypothetical protein [Bradyrhizobium liaoningense]